MNKLYQKKVKKAKVAKAPKGAKAPKAPKVAKASKGAKVARGSIAKLATGKPRFGATSGRGMKAGSPTGASSPRGMKAGSPTGASSKKSPINPRSAMDILMKGESGPTAKARGAAVKGAAAKIGKAAINASPIGPAMRLNDLAQKAFSRNNFK
jgi:hypothetical protein